MDCILPPCANWRNYKHPLQGRGLGCLPCLAYCKGERGHSWRCRVRFIKINLFRCLSYTSMVWTRIQDIIRSVTYNWKSDGRYYLIIIYNFFHSQKCLSMQSISISICKNSMTCWGEIFECHKLPGNLIRFPLGLQLC